MAHLPSSSRSLTSLGASEIQANDDQEIALASFTFTPPPNPVYYCANDPCDSSEHLPPAALQYHHRANRYAGGFEDR